MRAEPPHELEIKTREYGLPPQADGSQWEDFFDNMRLPRECGPARNAVDRWFWWLCLNPPNKNQLQLRRARKRQDRRFCLYSTRAGTQMPFLPS